MATLLDHRRQTQTPGAVEGLVELMITAEFGTPHIRRLNKRSKSGASRQAEASVRSAVRRGGSTGAGLQLVLSDTERAAWEANNPIPS